jgi:membrane-bound inhibitor of C-type lysozyme
MSRVSIWLAGFAVAGLLAVPAGAQDEVPMSTATFVCADNKSIVANFYPDEVALTLSDGRGIDLPQVISGSGTRYANADESIQFFSKGDTAFLTEDADDNLTYKDCVAD